MLEACRDTAAQFVTAVYYLFHLAGKPKRRNR
jgi:hypothetical protein